MKLLDLLHRWTGGFLGLVLFILGLTGAILVHKDDWVMLPHAGDARMTDPVAIGAATQKMVKAEPWVQGIVYASDRFGLDQLRTKGGKGAYATQSGEVVERWASQWERPEVWIFDLHHHLFADDAGEWVAGVAGVAGIFFVITGVILWWRTRKTFKFRLLPKRMSRPAIVMHHRDLGVIVAPLLFLSALTGSMMLFKPVAMLVVAPFTPPGQVAKALKAPEYKSGPLSPDFDWQAAVIQAHQRFPDAQIRILSIPRKPGDPVSIRMKRAGEWLPNGRSTLWFDATTGKLLGSRDALAMPTGAQVYNAAYPLHAAKVGGLSYRLLMTISGLAMALLGSFAVWSFWFRGGRKAKPFASRDSRLTA